MNALIEFGLGSAVGTMTSCFSGILGMPVPGCFKLTNGSESSDQAFTVGSSLGAACLTRAVSNTSPWFAVPAILTSTAVPVLFSLLKLQPDNKTIEKKVSYITVYAALIGSAYFFPNLSSVAAVATSFFL